MLDRQDQTGLHLLQGGFALQTQWLQHGDRDQSERKGEGMRLGLGEDQRVMAPPKSLLRVS
jgi:hypothetical protein